MWANIKTQMNLAMSNNNNLSNNSNVSERPGSQPPTPARWRGLNEPTMERPRAPVAAPDARPPFRMLGLDALEYSAMRIPKSSGSYVIPHRRPRPHSDTNDVVGPSTASNNNSTIASASAPTASSDHGTATSGILQRGSADEERRGSRDNGEQPPVKRYKMGALMQLGMRAVKRKYDSHGMLAAEFGDADSSSDEEQKVSPPPLKKKKLDDDDTTIVNSESKPAASSSASTLSSPSLPLPSSGGNSNDSTKDDDTINAADDAAVAPPPPAVVIASPSSNSNNVTFDDLMFARVKSLCKEHDISVPKGTKAKSVFVDLLSAKFPSANDLVAAEPLESFTKENLVAKCRAMSLPETGSKPALVKRLRDEAGVEM